MAASDADGFGRRLMNALAYGLCGALACAVATPIGVCVGAVDGPVGLDIVTIARETLSRCCAGAGAGLAAGAAYGLFRRRPEVWQSAVYVLIVFLVAASMAVASLRQKIALGRGLYDAIETGDVARARAALDAGADVNQRDWYSPENWDDYDEDSLLAVAAERGRLDIVRLMVERGADTSIRYHWTALEAAAFSGNDAIVEYLLSRGASTQVTNHDGKSALSQAVEFGHIATARILQAHGARPTLLDAAAMGDERAVRDMLQGGVDIEATDRYGETALMRAARSGLADAARLLLKCGACVDARRRASDPQDGSDGETPLMIAASHAGPESDAVLNILLGGGANPNAVTRDGTTALMDAVGAGNDVAVRLLLAHGANVNAKDARGTTAYRHARLEGQEQAARLIASRGGK